MLHPLLLALLAVTPAGLGTSAPRGESVPNLLVIVADDLGQDMVGAYGVGTDLAPTPTIDALAASGVVFRRAYSNPASSPTRAVLQTGRYCFRTGIGWTVTDIEFPLQLSETILPEALQGLAGQGYASGYFGKWHLGNAQVGGGASPNVAGYDAFAGHMGNITQSGYNYYSWPKFENGSFAVSTTYLTTDVVDEAIAWTATAPEPWVCFVAYLAPHAPYHTPPAHLFTVDLPTQFNPHTDDPRPFYKAMVEALDTETGRLLDALGPDVRARTNVVFLGDNGTPNDVLAPPFTPGNSKSSLYDVGIRIPLIVSGPSVADPGRDEHALVGLVDLFATALDLAGIPLASAVPPGVTIDSISFAPYLSNPHAPDQRKYVFSENFKPNGFSFLQTDRMIREERYKLLRHEPPLVEEFYDLALDPFETHNLLLGNLSDPEKRKYRQLKQQLDALLQSP